MQIIADEISNKNKYQAHIICTLMSDRKTHQFNISRATSLISLKNSETSCCWYESNCKARNEQEQQNMFVYNSAAVRFDDVGALGEFKRVFAECQSKMENKMEFSFTKSAWQPPDSLSDDVVNLINEGNVKFERQITFNLNNLFNYTGVSLKLYDSYEISSKKIYIILVELNKNVYFKHYINRDQKFDTRYVLFICTYLVNYI